MCCRPSLMEFAILQERSKKNPLVRCEFLGITSKMTEALQIDAWKLSVSVIDSPACLLDVRLTRVRAACRRSRRQCTAA